MISRDTQGQEVKDSNGDRNPLSQDAAEETAEVVLEGETLQSTIEAILFASAEPVSRRRLNAMLKEAPKGAVKEALLALEAQLITTSRGYLLHEDGAGLRLLSGWWGRTIRSDDRCCMARLRNFWNYWDFLASMPFPSRSGYVSRARIVGWRSSMDYSKGRDPRVSIRRRIHPPQVPGRRRTPPQM